MIACGRPGLAARSHPRAGAALRLRRRGAGAARRGSAGARCSWGRPGCGCSRPDVVIRFDARTLQELGQLRASQADRGGERRLRRAVAAYPQPQRRLCAPYRRPGLPGARRGSFALRRSADRAGRRPGRHWLAVLDSPEDARAPTANEWRLHIVDLATCRTAKPHLLQARAGEEPPRHLAIDSGRPHPPRGIRMRGAPLLAVSREGEEVARQPLGLPPSASPVSGLLWQGPIAGRRRRRALPPGGRHRGGRGCGRVARHFHHADPHLARRHALGLEPRRYRGGDAGGGDAQGELRAAAVKPRPARIDNIRHAFASTSASPAARLATVDPLIAWDGDTRTYHGAGGGKRMLRFLLDGARETHLWLKLEFECPAGASPVSLFSRFGCATPTAPGWTTSRRSTARMKVRRPSSAASSPR